MKKILITLTLLALLPLKVMAIDNIKELQQHLSKQDLTRGTFSQERVIKIFKKPLVSTGSFVLAKHKGLIWQQLKPFSNLLVLRANKLKQKVAAESYVIIKAQENPMVFYFTHIFLDLFNGNFVNLKAAFTIEFTHSNQKWVLTLRPKQAPINKVFEQIILSGSEQLESICLKELRGDSTIINLTPIRGSSLEGLTNAEQAEFTF